MKAEHVFVNALKDPKAENYAGLYMYMGTWNGKDEFKHYDTRKYLP